MGQDQSFLGFTVSPKATAQIVEAMTRAVAVSYVNAPTNRTDETDRQRTRMCVALIRIMRGDLKWSIKRITDELPRAITDRLVKGDWVPEENKSVWAGPNSQIVVNPAALRHALPDPQ